MKLLKIGILILLTVGAYSFFKKPLNQRNEVPSKTKDLATSEEKQRSVASVTDDTLQNKNLKLKRNDSLRLLQEEMKRLSDCRSSETCEFSHTDPKSYSIELNKKVTLKLKAFKESAKLSELEKQQLAETLREWMLVDDGFVQSVVLDQFAQLPVSIENLNAIVEGVQNNQADPLIMAKALSEMKRYVDTDGEVKVVSFVSEALMTGPQYSSEQAASSVRELLTAHNWNSFNEIYKNLPSGTVKRNLKRSLEDFSEAATGA